MIKAALIYTGLVLLSLLFVLQTAPEPDKYALDRINCALYEQDMKGTPAGVRCSKLPEPEANRYEAFGVTAVVLGTTLIPMWITLISFLVIRGIFRAYRRTANPSAVDCSPAEYAVQQAKARNSKLEWQGLLFGIENSHLEQSQRELRIAQSELKKEQDQKRRGQSSQPQR